MESNDKKVFIKTVEKNDKGNSNQSSKLSSCLIRREYSVKWISVLSTNKTRYNKKSWIWGLALPIWLFCSKGYFS